MLTLSFSSISHMNMRISVSSEWGLKKQLLGKFLPSMCSYYTHHQDFWHWNFHKFSFPSMEMLMPVNRLQRKKEKLSHEKMCCIFCSLNDTNVFSVVVCTLWLSYLLWKRLLSTSSPCIVLHSCGLTCRIILNMFDRDQYRAAGGICVPYSQSPSSIHNEPQIGQQSNYPK